MENTEKKEALGKSAKIIIRCLAAAALVIPYRVKTVYADGDKKKINKIKISAVTWSFDYDESRADGKKSKLNLIK